MLWTTTTFSPLQWVKRSELFSVEPQVLGQEENSRQNPPVIRILRHSQRLALESLLFEEMSDTSALLFGNRRQDLNSLHLSQIS